ncbi:MAG: pyridoxal phosphate-dependent aminotransferase [Nitrospinae bacterium]|nr:pyridoxal phosphate-dependent aminotransferase [Nitrospinota bacterium]
MSVNISRLAKEVSPFIVMDVMEKAKEMERAGENIVHLEIGEPDFDTPEPIKQAGVAAILEGKTKYTHSLGLLELRKAIADAVKQECGREIDHARILVTSGSSNALFLTLAAVVDPGDEVIMSGPCYSCYPNFVKMAGGTPIHVPVTEDEGFQLNPAKVAEKITKRTRAIMINSPANPTGAVLGADAMREIAELGPLIISDEIYRGMVYEGEAKSILEFTNDAVMLDGFSKRYAMTGWRLGYAIVPETLARPMQKLQQNIYISANSFVQWAGVAALREGADAVEAMRKVFGERRKFILDGLEQIGLPVKSHPQGAFYVFVDVSRYTRDSLSFAFEILEKAKVAVTPGVDFGADGEGFIRLSYATSIENIGEGLKRLGLFLKSRQ